jgi:hypothetical protein
MRSLGDALRSICHGEELAGAEYVESVRELLR